MSDRQFNQSSTGKMKTGAGLINMEKEKAHTDLSVTGWNVQAVKMASYLDLPFIGIDECIQKARAFAQKCQDPAGRFAYKMGGEGKTSLTRSRCILP